MNFFIYILAHCVCVADEYDEMLLARKLGNLVSPLDIYKPCVDKHSRQSSPMTSKTSREDDPSLSLSLMGQPIFLSS